MEFNFDYFIIYYIILFGLIFTIIGIRITENKKSKKQEIPNSTPIDKYYKYEDKKNIYEWQRIWEYLKCADDDFHRRFNFFLVAESMLIVSFATLFGSDKAKIIRIAIICLGLIYTFSWYYVNSRINKKMEFLLLNFLEKKDRYFNAYMYCVKERIGRWDYFNADVLPISTFLFWLFLSLQMLVSIDIKSFILILIILGTIGYLLYIFVEKFLLEDQEEKKLKDLGESKS